MRRNCKRPGQEQWLIVAPAVVTPACSPSRGAPAWAAGATHTITIEGMQFTPAELTVKRGDRVVWVNKDLVTHTATAGKAFDSGNIGANESWAHVMSQPGRYDYMCTLHPTMKATLIVE
jgi:plastocyanin